MPPGSTTVQHRPSHFCSPENAGSALALRTQEEQPKKHPEFVVPVHQVFLILIGKLHTGVRGGAVG
jgi:hypothetical protein